MIHSGNLHITLQHDNHIYTVYVWQVQHVRARAAISMAAYAEGPNTLHRTVVICSPTAFDNITARVHNIEVRFYDPC